MGVVNRGPEQTTPILKGRLGWAWFNLVPHMYRNNESEDMETETVATTARRRSNNKRKSTSSSNSSGGGGGGGGTPFSKSSKNQSNNSSSGRQLGIGNFFSKG